MAKPSALDRALAKLFEQRDILTRCIAELEAQKDPPRAPRQPRKAKKDKVPSL